MRSLRFAPALLTALLLVPACDRGKELTPEEIAAKLVSDLEEASARVRNHKLKDAEKIYVRVLEEHPGNADAIGGLGQVKLEQKDYAMAEELLTKALASKSDDARLHAALGQAQHLSDEHAEAAKAYAQAFSLDPNNSDYGLSLGRELNESGEFARAEEILRGVADLDHKVRFVYTQLGDSLREQDKLDEALRTYMKAQNTYRDDKMAHAGAAFVYEAKGDNTHALNEWSSYIRMDCCSEFSKDVAQQKVDTLVVDHGDDDQVVVDDND